MSTALALLRSMLPSSPFKLVKLVRWLLLVQRRDVQRVDELQGYFFHPSFRYTVGGRGRISGVYPGWPEYRDQIVLGEVVTPGTVLAITTDTGRVCLLTHLTGERKGKTLDLDVWFEFRFAGGKIIEGRSVPVDAYAWDEFWA